MSTEDKVAGQGRSRLSEDGLKAAVAAIASVATRADNAFLALGEILALIAPALGADSGAIALPNPDSGKLETEARFALPAEGDLPLAFGQGVAGWVAWHGKPLLIQDTAADPRYRAVRKGVRCQMAAPMVARGDQVLGVITLDSNSKRGFSPRDLEALVRLTEEATRVMDRLWELGHLQGKGRQLEALLSAGQSFVSKLEAQELFDTLARDSRDLMQARVCALYIYSPETQTVRAVSWAGQTASPLPAGELPVDACLVAGAIHTRKPVAFSDIQSPEYLDLPDLPRDVTLRSVLTTPVAYEGEVLGVLTVFLERVHRFDNDEKRLFATLASLGAVALQNTRLYARVFRSEESLRKNEQLTMLGLLAAEIAHEIRNPLTVLKLLHGGLGVDFAETDPRHTDMRVIGEKLDQLEAIVTKVLSFGQAPSSLHTRCALAEMIEDTLVLVRLKLAQSKIQVRFVRPSKALVVDGHKGQLQQALLNLIINAMQAMAEGGSITITLDAPENQGVATIDVEDTGPGVPEAIRSRIFDSFLTGRPGGTGLGLAIAKRVLVSHHGDIELAATGPTGTTFRLRLPLAKN